jgi:hypothetical protein
MNYAPSFGQEKEMFKLIPVICTPFAVPLILGLMSLWWVTKSRFDRCAAVSLRMAEAILGSALVSLERDA